MSLRVRTFSAVRWTTVDAAGKAILSLLTVAILARILVPEDYGLMAIVAVMLGIASLFADLGVNSAYVQRSDVTVEQRSSLYWLNVLVSVGVAALFIGLAPPVAWFYGDPRLLPLMSLSAVIIVVRALGQQVRMAAEKDLRFRSVVASELAAALLALIASVSSAISGWGVYALVVSSVVSASLATLFYWVFISGGWRPELRLRVADVRPFLGFGSATVANNLVNFVNRSIDIFLAGRLLTASLLGLYSVPRMLVLELGGMINTTVTRVGFPLIAQVQADVARVRSVYLQTVNMTSAVNAPFYIALAFFAPEIVNVVLGVGWERSAELLRLLAIWGAIRSTGNPVGSLLYGTGRAGLSMRWNIGLMVVLAPAVWLGSEYGPEGIAWALLLVQALLFVPAWYFLVRPACAAGFYDYATTALRPFALATLAIAAGYVVASLVDGSLSRLAVGAAIAGPIYLALSYFANRSWLVAVAELAGARSPRSEP